MGLAARLVGRIPVASAALFAGAVMSAVAAELPKISPGLSYRAARIYLMQAGSRPVAVLDRGPDGCGPSQDVCVAYPEMIVCAGTGLRPCSFKWKSKSGRLFAVDTDGENLRQIVVTALRPLDPDKKSTLDNH
jgi:hypothetical protein